MRNRHTVRWAEKIHTERWYCDLDHGMTEEFERQENLEAHLKAEHGKQLTSSQLRGRLRRNKRVAARDALVCPICDCMPDDILTAVNDDVDQLLWAHIGRHLKSLAFLSLPYDQFVTGKSQSTFGSTSKSEDGMSCTSHPAAEQRDTDFADIPETTVTDDGDCKVQELIHPSCLSEDPSCCRLQPHNQVATFRAEADVSEDVQVDWIAARLEEKRATILQPDYTKLGKGLGNSRALLRQVQDSGHDGSSSYTLESLHNGSLRDYWNMCEEQGPNARLIKEAVEQLKGLADAIRYIHDERKRGNSRASAIADTHKTPREGVTTSAISDRLKKSFKTRNLTGGIGRDPSRKVGVAILDTGINNLNAAPGLGTPDLDIRPENIYRFGAVTDQGQSTTRLGTLRISDSSFADEHEHGLHIRNLLIEVSGTTQDQISEMAGGGHEERSELHDLWSLACVILEFVIWILYGRNGLKKFHTELEDSELYDGETSPHVHGVVVAWTHYMMLRDPECADHTAIWDLLMISSSVNRSLSLLLFSKGEKRDQSTIRPSEQPKAKKPKQDDQSWDLASSTSLLQDQVMWDGGPDNNKGKWRLTSALGIEISRPHLSSSGIVAMMDDILGHISFKPETYFFSGKSRENVRLPKRVSSFIEDEATATDEHKADTSESSLGIRDLKKQSDAAYKPSSRRPQPSPRTNRLSGGSTVPVITREQSTKFKKGHIVYKAVVEDGRERMGVFRVHATRYNSAKGYHEYQLQDLLTRQIESGWTREKDLKSGD
jgi:serine/threonine protein kinase